MVHYPVIFVGECAETEYTFAMDSLLSSVMMIGRVTSCIAGGTSSILPVSLSTSTRGDMGNVYLSLGVVLFIPYCGCFIHPFAVAGLGLRYFSIISSEIYGQPLRKLFLVAFNNLDILGLHNAWCWNFTLLARVVIECVNMAACTFGVAVLSGTERLRG
jgi:hypothetical protein